MFSLYKLTKIYIKNKGRPCMNHDSNRPGTGIGITVAFAPEVHKNTQLRECMMVLFICLVEVANCFPASVSLPTNPLHKVSLARDRPQGSHVASCDEAHVSLTLDVHKDVLPGGA